MGSYTAYQLSKDLNANFRTVTRLLKSFEEKRLIEIDGTMLENKATVYNISDEVLNEITTRLQAYKSSNTIVRNSDNERNLSKLKELQEQLIQQDTTIKSLNQLIANKEKDLQTLSTANIQLSADLKVATGEIKFIEDRRKTVEADNARLGQELKVSNDKINRLNKAVIVLSALLLIIIVSIFCFSIRLG